MEMQVRSSIQNLVLAFRADATDIQRRDYIHGEYPEYAFRAVNESHHAATNSGRRMAELALGVGAFSAACPHPTDTNKVVKVWLNGIDGAWHYINKCWQLQGTGDGQDWMPVVYELGMCMGKPYAIMERLTGKVIVALEIERQLTTKFELHFGFYPNDVHSGNVMFRQRITDDGVPEEVPVLTDPVTIWE